MIKNELIALEHTVVQTDGNIASDMDGEKVMLSIRNGKYYNLGELGGVIWDLIQLPVTVAHVVETLLSQYEVERAVCEEHVLSFLGNLLEEGLIQIQSIEI